MIPCDYLSKVRYGFANFFFFNFFFLHDMEFFFRPKKEFCLPQTIIEKKESEAWYLMGEGPGGLVQPQAPPMSEAASDSVRYLGTVYRRFTTADSQAFIRTLELVHRWHFGEHEAGRTEQAAAILRLARLLESHYVRLQAEEAAREHQLGALAAAAVVAEEMDEVLRMPKKRKRTEPSQAETPETEPEEGLCSDSDSVCEYVPETPQ